MHARNGYYDAVNGSKRCVQHAAIETHDDSGVILNIKELYKLYTCNYEFALKCLVVYWEIPEADT